MTKREVLQKIREVGVVPVVRASSAEEATRAIEAVRAGGVNIFEITMTVPDALNLIKNLTAKFGETALIGAGTVLTPEQARDCIAAGAKFIISPVLNLETIKICNENDVAVMPGALTPTEIVTAWNAGADLVKVFPAGALGGANYIKSLKAPLPQIEIIPTGGVSLKTAADFIKAGASALGVGADLIDLQALREGNDDILTERARQYLEIVRTARADK
ncbi:MAG: bifunctional 4-hydroxy-2-oxoglutarate aldolase/2-dehydro-3-deoxy-phosphogluconate aldolase [Acidobacteria bacterium]|nr:bifunctional 4-hydroxy-2-oxoglutarate aldolase/2-dehydro-3-deoxy-phosphogluconate aldolase [Acidobacteriota bacterium]MCA1637305.1 bifunctional 4-hydroxy-2-oxoglutarate aldolase/2-dehydro-3-deoxy-phosphogluconate aldolase [Acidobacteriota bacterium]